MTFRLIPVLAFASAMTCALVAALGITPSRAADDVEPTAKSCIVDKDMGFYAKSTNYTFAMNFENTCDRPITCTVDVYVTGARGPTSGHTVLTFPPRGQTPSQNSYILNVKAVNGSAQVGRACNFL
jgi:hypothetical protein